MIGSRAVAIALTVVGLGAGSASAQQLDPMETQSPRSGVIEVKLGSYRPLIDSEPGLTNAPYAETFGNSGMLMVEFEYDRMLFQSFGSAGFGIGIGYAEKYSRATVTTTGDPAAESTSLKVLPLRALAVYRFDFAALKYNVPLTPFVKAGLVYAPFWASKGSGLTAEGDSGGQWGYAFSAGLGFMLDVIDQRIQRDFDSEMGVNHTYAFAEYTYEDVSDFGRGFVLSSRRFSFGLAFDF